MQVALRSSAATEFTSTDTDEDKSVFADLKRDVDAGAITDVDDDVLLFERLEAGRFRLDVVPADSKTRHDVLAGLVADIVANLAGFVVGNVV